MKLPEPSEPSSFFYFFAKYTIKINGGGTILSTRIFSISRRICILQLQSTIQQVEDGVLAHIRIYTRHLQSEKCEWTSEIRNTKQSMTLKDAITISNDVKGIICHYAFVY